MELSNPELLTAPDVAKRKIFMTDASDYVLGVVLIQIDEDGLCRKKSFTSLKLKSAEVKYTVMEK